MKWRQLWSQTERCPFFQENMYLYNATPDSPEWIAYQEAMEDVILEGLTEAVRCSLAYMSDHTDKAKSEMPLMQGSLIIDVS